MLLEIKRSDINLIKYTIPRANVNMGFDYEEAILEGIDDAFEAANGKTQVECWIKKDTDGNSYLIGDIAGGANYTKLFNIPYNREFYEQFQNEHHLNESTSVFGAGSLSHLHVSNEVWFFTKYENENIVLQATKNLSTGDFSVEQVNTTAEEIFLKYKFDISEIGISKFDSLLYVRNFNGSTNQFVNSFKEKEQFIGFEKNLRSTFADKIDKGYSLKLNGKELTPLDIFYKEELGKFVRHVDTIEITLKELLEINSYYKDEIYTRYLKLFRDVNSLNNQNVKISIYSFDTKYFNNTYFKENPNDSVTFNIESSGYWIFRNGRKIGNPTLLRTIHPSFNNFRAYIEFNPVFDKFFGIQVNKNRYVLDNVLKELITIKINQFLRERGLGSFSNLLNFDKTVNNNSTQLTLWGDGIDTTCGELKGDRSIKKIKYNDPLWRRAEKYALRALEIELPDFKIFDVSKSNTGYDLKAINPNTSEEIYVEVKLLAKTGASFDLTPKEFNVASLEGDNYFTILVYLGESDVTFTCIKNLTKSLLPKVISEIVKYRYNYYEGTSYSLTYEELGLE